VDWGWEGVKCRWEGCARSFGAIPFRCKYFASVSNLIILYGSGNQWESVAGWWGAIPLVYEDEKVKTGSISA